MELYDKKINEFTDWVSGTNSLTGGNDTEGQSVSGARIRELLLEKLKKPIYVWHDRDNRLYRIFSSTEAKDIWLANPEQYANLEITNFAAPSEYSIEVILGSNDIAYVRYGLTDLENAKIKYSWKVVNSQGNLMSESMNVTYSIRENGKSYSTIKSSSEKEVVEDMTEYLSLGSNTIDIDFTGVTTGTITRVTVTINAITLNISTDLTYETLQRNLSSLLFNMYAERNIPGPLTFETSRYYYGNKFLDTDIVEVTKNDFSIQSSQENNLTPSALYKETDLMKGGMHVVQVLGKMVPQSSNLTFYSNLIYYIIGAAYNVGEVPTGMFNGIALKYKLDNRISLVGTGDFLIIATQYEPVSLEWSYIRYIDSKTNTVEWIIVEQDEDGTNSTEYHPIGSYTVSSGTIAPNLNFIPTIHTALGKKTYLVAYIGGNQIISIPIWILESNLGISETTGIDLLLKFSAYGKWNGTSSTDTWFSEVNSYYATFNGIKWNEASGWYNNSLRLSGEDSYGTINYNPFNSSIDAGTKGLTVEIEFLSEYVSSVDDELIRLGGTQSAEPHISIYANKASLYIQNYPIITTNYKANERVKLAFIVFPKTNVSSELLNTVFIVNNGIAERAVGWKDYGTEVFNCNSGLIKIGQVASGVRVYNIRCYSRYITITNAYNNYVYDSDDKATIVSNNNIYKSGEINLEECQKRIDTIILLGNLSKVLSRDTTKSGSNSSCDITRVSVKDPSKNLKVIHGRIRKHGQSTLNYPLTSYKIWTWSSVDETRPTMILDGSTDLPFAKNRYLMKTNSIPANKFVLQANYADSSGVHNGGFLRLIQDTWYNAKIDGEYKLRTQPQLFSSNQTISVLEGDTSDDTTKRLFMGYNEEGKLWNDYFPGVTFPYTIRNAPDSFPCLVFYQNTDAGDTAPKFLGLYVFMDDKKSDFVYGERSLYKVENNQAGTNNANDPFCVRASGGGSVWDEDEGIKIWDNDKVLRIEVLSVNSTLADYRGTIADNSKRRYDDIIKGDTEDTTSIGWEEDFELVYPEKEEITTKKAFDADKFERKVKPFTEWLGWLIGTYKNQDLFERTAASHLDLYKMAAYYIFVLRFGLVDSLERNAQIKTYDGVHFHYEPWDMDIALGNRNTGGIVFNPPIDRNTMMDTTTAAISGRSWIDTNGDKEADTMVSNWLFDALEAWPYWTNEIIPKVADALFSVGLTYQNVIDMLDGNYQNAWSESIYNESGNFKYVVNRQEIDDKGNIVPNSYDDDWLAWLQGARTTHRHWWLKTSMDYYDAKWGVGEFNQRRMYIGCEMHNVNGTIDIVPTADTYFAFVREATKFGPYSATPLNPLHFNMLDINSGAKVPFYIYGANFIKEIDISSIAAGLLVFNISGAYSSENGPVITKVNIGVPLTTEEADHMEGSENLKGVTLSSGSALNAIEELNIRGQGGLSSVSFLGDTKTIQKLYAAGSGINTLTSAIGTEYDTLELPDTLTTITFNSTTWNPDKLSFWITTHGASEEVVRTEVKVDDNGNTIYDSDGNPVYEEYTDTVITLASYDRYVLEGVDVKTAIPKNLLTARFTGTTGKNACARQFVVDWITSILTWGELDWNNLTAEEKSEYDNELDNYLVSLFKLRTLSVEKIYWNNIEIAGLSYEYIRWMAMFNNINYNELEQYDIHPNVVNFANGYLVITDSTDLTGIQTSYLSTWFGNNVFVLNSSGLVIDLTNNYIAITVGASAYTIDGEIYLQEGRSARISATLFRLQETLNEKEFYIRKPGTANYLADYQIDSVKVCYITDTQSEDDHIYYLVTTPNPTGENYDIELISGSSSVIIHILALEYPEKIILSAFSVNQENDVKNRNSYNYYKLLNAFSISLTGNLIFGLWFKQDSEYLSVPKNLNITSVKFKLYDSEGNIYDDFIGGKDYTYFTQLNSTSYLLSVDNTLAYTMNYIAKDNIYKYFIPLYILNVISSGNKYTLEAEIKIGGMTKTVSQDLLIISDNTIAMAGTPLWGIINNAYKELYGDNFTGTVSFTKAMCYFLNKTVSVEGTYYLGSEWVKVSDNLVLKSDDKELNNLFLISNEGESIFKALPNITGIKLDGAYKLSSYEEINGVNVEVLDLVDNPKLETFSIVNCSGLTEDIDLSYNKNIKSINASGTSINVFIPNNITLDEYRLGTPTDIVMDNVTIPVNSVSIDSASSLNNISLYSDGIGMYNLYNRIMNSAKTNINALNKTGYVRDGLAFWIDKEYSVSSRTENGGTFKTLIDLISGEEGYYYNNNLSWQDYIYTGEHQIYYNPKKVFGQEITNNSPSVYTFEIALLKSYTDTLLRLYNVQIIINSANLIGLCNGRNKLSYFTNVSDSSLLAKNSFSINNTRCLIGGQVAEKNSNNINGNSTPNNKLSIYGIGGMFQYYSIRIYNRILSEEELLHNYEIDKKRFEL